MVSDKDWKKGVKKIGVRFGPAKTICKPCFEEFNESPKYLTVDEYMALQAELMKKYNLDSAVAVSPETIAYECETVAALWDLSPQFTEEEREDAITRIGWPRGPYHKSRKTEPRKSQRSL